VSEQEFKPFSIASQSDIAEQLHALNDNVLFNNSSDFSHFIESAAKREDRSCTDVILEYCDSRDIEPDDISRLISPSLKGKIEREMIESGLMSERNTLENF
jgi:predicted class III extradiol MEMO1 family dioxygenase